MDHLPSPKDNNLLLPGDEETVGENSQVLDDEELVLTSDQQSLEIDDTNGYEAPGLELLQEGRQLLAFGEEMVREGQDIIAFTEMIREDGEDRIGNREEMLREGQDLIAEGTGIIQQGGDLLYSAQEYLLRHQLPKPVFEELEDNDLFKEIRLGVKTYKYKPVVIPNEVLNKLRNRILPFSCLEPSGEQCSVCMNEFQRTDILRRMECLHHFHARCIADWLKTTLSCPVCRSPVYSNSASVLMRSDLSPFSKITSTKTSPEKLPPTIYRSHLTKVEINGAVVTFVNYFPSALIVKDCSLNQNISRRSNGRINYFENMPPEFVLLTVLMAAGVVFRFLS